MGSAQERIVGIPVILIEILDDLIDQAWRVGEETQIATADRESLKSKLVSVLIPLANSLSLLIQYSEAISIIATSDFPEQWPDLIDKIVQNFNQNDWNANNALLSTAHAIFKSLPGISWVAKRQEQCYVARREENF
ncbi:hypothetical protein PtA15_10A64 [Puccinia triticina]|uniref:Importin N-terminal domain-containing protein n=1 Tax=Puccinia triticina TaxID=208348 RepID=A0ABY7CUI2_9BASI|nr:uncharacterized protein PtA15_10A64 [Puccinia triticina]WAQ88645.1 hypothetical protein PtA15_10A64 [Puccinia triticina]